MTAKDIDIEAKTDQVTSVDTLDTHSLNKHKKSRTIVPIFTSKSAVLLHALKGGLRAFLLSFGIKSTVSLLVLMMKQRNLIKWRSELLPASRFGGMLGSFAFIWKLMNNILAMRSGKNTKRNGAIAGFIAGSLACLFESRKNRIGYCQQFCMRASQAGISALKSRSLPTIPNAPLTTGDSLLFCFASGMILYAYALYPKTLPRAYYDWLVKTARVPKIALNELTNHVKTAETGVIPSPIKNTSLFFEKTGATATVREVYDKYIKDREMTMPGLPCVLLHAKNSSCLSYATTLWTLVYKDMIPVYFALSFVPLVFLKPSAWMKNPIKRLQKMLMDASRSACFLSTFVASFQAMVCTFHHVYPEASLKRVLGPFGFVASALGISLEQKKKRAELAMFITPKALESFYAIMLQKKFMVDLPGIEILFSGMAMSMIMGVYQLEPGHLSGMLYRVMVNTLGDY